MKKIGMLILIFFCFSLIISSKTENPADKAGSTPAIISEADDSEWTEPVNVSKTPQECAWPKVTASNEGIAYIIWNQETEGRGVRFTSNEDEEWSTPANITGAAVRVKEGPWPELTLDTEGNIFVVYTAVTDGNYEIVYTRRKGNTWQPHENVSKTQAAGSVSATPLVDARNNDYFIHWQDDIDRPSENAVFWRTYVRYKDGGEGDWKAAGAIGSATGRDYGPEAAMDINGRMYAVWADRTGGQANVMFVESETPKINSSWKLPVDISGPTGLQFAEPQIACDHQGNVYVAWMHVVGGNYEVFFRKRINGVWEKIENISETAGVSEYPSIAVNRMTGQIYVTWHDDTPGNWEILLREFDGSKWLDVQNMSNTPAKSARTDIFCDEGGGVHLVYLDTPSGAWNVYYRMKEGVYTFPIYPPLNVQLEKTKLDDLTSAESTKTNTIIWEENPENEAHSDYFYLLYRKEHGQDDDQYSLIATLPENVFRYKDEGLPTSAKYWYALKCLSRFEEESEDFSNAVTEQLIWAIHEVLLETVINEFLFYKEKINTLSWMANPLNNSITIDKYEIYRKKTTEQDAPYSLIGSVGPDMFEYVDRKLPVSDKFLYAIRVVDDTGVSSPPSKPVFEE